MAAIKTTQKRLCGQPTHSKNGGRRVTERRAFRRVLPSDWTSPRGRAGSRTRRPEEAPGSRGWCLVDPTGLGSCSFLHAGPEGESEGVGGWSYLHMLMNANRPRGGAGTAPGAFWPVYANVCKYTQIYGDVVGRQSPKNNFLVLGGSLTRLSFPGVQ